MRQASWSDQSQHSPPDFWYTTGPFESVHQNPTEIHPRPRAEKVRMEGRPDFGGREPSGEAGGSKKKNGRGPTINTRRKATGGLPDRQAPFVPHILRYGPLKPIEMA